MFFCSRLERKLFESIALSVLPVSLLKNYLVHSRSGRGNGHVILQWFFTSVSLESTPAKHVNKKYAVTTPISGWHYNHSCQGAGAKSCIFGIPPPPFFLGVSYMGEGTSRGGTWPTNSEKLVTILNLLGVLRFWQPSYSLATILRICLASSQNSLTLFK